MSQPKFLVGENNPNSLSGGKTGVQRLDGPSSQDCRTGVTFINGASGKINFSAWHTQRSWQRYRFSLLSLDSGMKSAELAFCMCCGFEETTGTDSVKSIWGWEGGRRSVLVNVL